MSSPALEKASTRRTRRRRGIPRSLAQSSPWPASSPVVPRYSTVCCYIPALPPPLNFLQIFSFPTHELRIYSLVFFALSLIFPLLLFLSIFRPLPSFCKIIKSFSLLCFWVRLVVFILEETRAECSSLYLKIKFHLCPNPAGKLDADLRRSGYENLSFFSFLFYVPFFPLFFSSVLSPPPHVSTADIF